MVRPAGIEPATFCLEGRCSIQLSYGRDRGEIIGQERANRNRKLSFRCGFEQEETEVTERWGYFCQFRNPAGRANVLVSHAPFETPYLKSNDARP
jgi:hypothetical protein